MNSCIEEAEVSDVYSSIDVDKLELLANGQSTAKISVELNPKTSVDRRNVVFSTNSGVFSGEFKNKIIIKATFIESKLIAIATIIAPTKTGKMIIKIEPEFDSSLKEFNRSVEILLKESRPSKIILGQSNLGIEANFNSEVSISGIISNSENSNVSDGFKIQFEDYLQNGESANGLFRNVKNVTKDSSKVSCIYGSSSHPVGTKIIVVGTLLDENNDKTAIKDSIFLIVNK